MDKSNEFYRYFAEMAVIVETPENNIIKKMKNNGKNNGKHDIELNCEKPYAPEFDKMQTVKKMKKIALELGTGLIVSGAAYSLTKNIVRKLQKA